MSRETRKSEKTCELARVASHTEAVRDGTLWVIIILFLDVELSGQRCFTGGHAVVDRSCVLNTLTLGGIASNRTPLTVVYQASREVRNSIV
jgi:hypothetical protein